MHQNRFCECRRWLWRWCSYVCVCDYGVQSTDACDCYFNDSNASWRGGMYIVRAERITIDWCSSRWPPCRQVSFALQLFVVMSNRW